MFQFPNKPPCCVFYIVLLLFEVSETTLLKGRVGCKAIVVSLFERSFSDDPWFPFYFSELELFSISHLNLSEGTPQIKKAKAPSHF